MEVLKNSLKIDFFGEVLSLIHKMDLVLENNVTLKKEDLNNFFISAHSLKGAFGFASETELEYLCSKLEDIILEYKKTKSQNLFSKIKELFQKIKQDTASSISYKLSDDSLEFYIKDLAKSLNKDVNVYLDCEHYSFEISKLASVILHLVRNAIDHGIEKKEMRTSLGKTPVGTIRLKTYEKNNNFYLEIADDGRGVQERNLCHIFEEEFSTKNKVTKISGRGFGMSAALAKIKKEHGEIEIKTSLNKGTSFKIKIPLKREMEKAS